MGIYDRTYYQDDVPGTKPWDRFSMVTNVIIVNVAVMVLNMVFTSRDDALLKAIALYPEDLWQPLHWYRFLTYGFGHSSQNLFHILFNMMALYFLGQAVEMKYGRIEFLRIYLSTIVVAGLSYCVIRAFVPYREGTNVLGASGGVEGIVMLFVYNFPNATLSIWGVLPVKAWIVGIITIVINIMGNDRHVAYDVHLAGIAFTTLYFFGNLSFDLLSNLFRAPTTWFKRKPKLRVHVPSDDPPPPSRDETEADRILDKIYREGQGSLTAKEQQFLENYSRKVREKRQ